MMNKKNMMMTATSFGSFFWLASTMMTMMISKSSSSIVVAAASSHHHPRPVTVRSLVGFLGRGKESEDEMQQHHHRKMLNMEYTFSEEGLPFTIPLISIQLFPTPSPPLSRMSLTAIENAMQQYLLDTLPGQIRSSSSPDNGNNSTDNNDNSGNVSDDDDDTDRLITDITVTVLNVMSVSDGSRTRHYQRSLRQGSEVEMEVVLNFARQPIPSDNEIVAGMDNTMEDMDPFIQDYLLKQPSSTTTDELSNVDSALYNSETFTASPSASPSTPPPTDFFDVGGLGDSNEDGDENNNNDGGSTSSTSVLQDGDVLGFARATGSDNNTGNERNTKTLYFAVIAGVIAMILTMIIIGRRRQRARHIIGDDTLTIEQIKAQPPEIDFEDGGGWVEHMPDGQTTIQVSEMEPTPADVAAAQSNPSRYHVHNSYSSTANDHDSSVTPYGTPGIQINDGAVEGRGDDSCGDVGGGYLDYTPYGSPEVVDDDDQGYVLSPASSYDSSLQYDDEHQFHNNNNVMYHNNDHHHHHYHSGGIRGNSNNINNNLLPPVAYGDGNGFTSEEYDTNPSSNDMNIPRGAIKRVDMSGNVRSSNEI